MNDKPLNICFLDPEGRSEHRYFDVFNGIEPVGAISVAENIKGDMRNISFIQQLTQTNEEVISQIIARKPDILAVTSYSYNFNNSLEIVKRIRNKIGSLIVVYGGIHVTYCPEEALDTGLINFIVRNEGEVTFNELLKFIQSGRNDYEKIKGIGFKDTNGVNIINPERERIRDFGSLSFSKREGLNMDYKKESLTHLPVTQIRNAGMETARGCGFNCEFCTSKTFWKGGNIVINNHARIIEEMRYLKDKFGTNYILFTDERFIKKGRKRDVELLDLMIREGIAKDMNFSCFNTLRDVDEEILIKLKQAGCSYINYGVEAIDISVLKNMRKEHNKVDEARKVFEMTRNADIFGAALFMIGAPYESIGSIDKLENYVLANADVIDKIRIAYYTPFPGTTSFSQAEKDSIFHGKVYEDGKINYDFFTTKSVVITPKGLAKELGLEFKNKEDQDKGVEYYLKNRAKQIITRFYTSEKYFYACYERIIKNPALKDVYREWFILQNEKISNYIDSIPIELKSLIGMK